jgi:hypothetical protein
MTPQKKAIELVKKYFEEFIEDYKVHTYLNTETRMSIFEKREEFAKKCAFIAVDQILNEYWQHDTKRRDWWIEVKEEIKLL